MTIKMLRITIEMLPLGQENKKKLLGTMLVDNIASDGVIADYRVRIKRDDNVLTFMGNVFEHQRATGWGQLIRKAFTAAYPLSKREVINAKLEESNTEGQAEREEETRDESIRTLSETTDAINNATRTTRKRKRNK
jgi:hypothetical protein